MRRAQAVCAGVEACGDGGVGECRAAVRRGKALSEEKHTHPGDVPHVTCELLVILDRGPA